MVTVPAGDLGARILSTPYSVHSCDSVFNPPSRVAVSHRNCDNRDEEENSMRK